MKKLTLIRHAKSSWGHDVIDHQRPLKKRGFNDAHIVSKCLKSINKQFELIISSDAKRTKTTAQIFMANLNIEEGSLTFNHDLYDFSGEKLIQVIKNCDDSINNLMIFGHNYALTSFVNTFGSEYIENVPTSGVVIIQFNIENWKALKKGETLKTIFPRDFKN